MLNPSQKEVVLHSEGPLMVIAGPGTGKTFTLVKKVIYLLTEKSVDPESIFITTFTRKAVNELRLRIAEEIKTQNLKIDSNRIKISTFHSFCIEVLEREKYNVLDDLEQRYFIYKNMYEFEKIEGFNLLISSLAGNFQPRASLLQKQFNKLSEHNIHPEQLFSSTNKQVGVLGIVYDRYLHLLKNDNLLDFSTIQTTTLELLERKPEIMEKLQNQFRYVLVDEYQDTNTIQNQILFKFFSKVKNICVVGDDDQSIYRFRGATVRNILNFPHKFSHDNFKTVKLEVNFRSNSEIIDFYSQFMNRYDWESKRYEKHLISGTDSLNHPTVGKVTGVTSEEWEASLVNLIKTLKETEIISDYSDITFLAQSVKSPDSLSLIKRLNENGIPTYSPRSGNFFKKEEVKVVLGIALSLFKEYSKKNIYTTWDYSNFETYSYYKECINLLKNGAENRFKDMVSDLKEGNFNRENKFLDILYKFFSFDYFKNIFSEHNLEDKAYEIMENNLSILSNIIFQYEEKNGSIFQEDFFDFYLPFLKECGINEYENEREVSIKNHISFLTFHQSKGLEFPVVLVGSLDKEPRKSSNDFDKILREEVFKVSVVQFEEDEQEDFYRVFYTAFSRAKNYLFLTCKDNREVQAKGKKILTPSNFFGELVDSIKDYKEIFSLEKEFSILNDHSNFLKVENSKDKTFKKKYSFTGDIALYLQCPVKYRFLRYSNFPKTQSSKEYLGILVHNTVHNIHQRVLEKEIVTEDEVKTLLNSNYKQLRSKLNFTLDLDEKKIAYNSVINYLTLEGYSLMDIEKSEVELSILRDNYVLHGVLDLIKKKGNEYSIIDFKTSSEKPELVPENYKKQLYIYGFLAESSGYPIKNLELYYTALEKEPKTSFPYTKIELNQVLKEADETVEKIINKQFFTSSFSNHCTSCPFIHYCSK